VAGEALLGIVDERYLFAGMLVVTAHARHAAFLHRVVRGHIKAGQHILVTGDAQF
jgi:hypothetical protein